VLKEIALENSIAYMHHPNINSPEFIEMISPFSCDLFVSMSFNQLFKKTLIDLPEKKIINCHAGRLPFYRGRNILNWALINDEKQFGITVHYVDENIDTGDIIMQKNYDITDIDDYSSLLSRAYEGCATILYESIKKISAGTVVATPQKHVDRFGFYCVARKDGDERIDWNQSSRDIFNFVRAICRPGPQARTFLGSEEIKINKVKYLPNAPCYKGIQGSVVGVNSKSFFVKTADSFVEVIAWGGYEKPRIGDRLK
jgi:methionyl-tRNA formyltransferase